MKENKKYVSPQIHKVLLDNEISLILTSAPPEGPNETRIIRNSDSFQQDVLMV
jgi:hypothetical protein